MKSNNQKTVLVTGANRGIGLEVCKQLGMLGFNVFLSARNSEKGTAAVDQLKKISIATEFIPMDVSSEESIKKAFNYFKSFSTGLDVLINNAGIIIEAPDFTNLPTEKLLLAITINAVGAFIVIREFLPLLKDGARIINVSSGAGSLNDSGGYAPAYSISKTTMNAITTQFAFALRDKNIKVNSVCPGWVRTDMGGWTAPRSIKKGAETIVWLATEVPIDKTGLFWRDKNVIEW